MEGLKVDRGIFDVLLKFEVAGDGYINEGNRIFLLHSSVQRH